MNVAWRDIPAGLQVAIAIYLVIQIGIEVYALVDLLRTPAQRVVGGRKWLWALLILLVNLVGAVVYLVAGKRPAPAEDPARTSADASHSAEDRARRAAELLYGPGGESGPRGGDGGDGGDGGKR